MKRIAVICTEQSILRAIHSIFSDGPIGSVEHEGISYSIPSKGVILSLGSNGLVFAAIHCSNLCHQWRPDLVIHFGTAGAIGSALPIGTLVRISQTHQWDLNCSALGFPQGEMPRAHAGSAIPADGAKLCHHDTPAGILLSGNQFVNFQAQPHLFRTMASRHEGCNVLVDMEGYGVNAACEFAGFDCLQLRVIMNNGAGSPADYNGALQTAGGTCANELLTIIGNLMS